MFILLELTECTLDMCSAWYVNPITHKNFITRNKGHEESKQMRKHTRFQIVELTLFSVSVFMEEDSEPNYRLLQSKVLLSTCAQEHSPKFHLPMETVATLACGRFFSIGPEFQNKFQTVNLL